MPTVAVHEDEQVQFRVRLSLEQKQALDDFAGRHQKTLTRVVENALAREFAAHEETWPENTRRIA